MPKNSTESIKIAAASESSTPITSSSSTTSLATTISSTSLTETSGISTLNKKTENINGATDYHRDLIQSNMITGNISNEMTTSGVNYEKYLRILNPIKETVSF